MRLSLEMPAQLEAIDAMVVTLRQAVQSLLSAEDLFGFEVAISEALTNIVKHSFDATVQTSAANVSLTLTCGDQTIALDLIDHGKPGPADMFAKVPRLEDIDILAEHGRGLALIRHYSDLAEFSTGPHGNRLRLTFKPSASAQREGD